MPAATRLAFPRRISSRRPRVQRSGSISWLGKKAPAAFHTYCATWIKSTTMISGMFPSSAIGWRWSNLWKIAIHQSDPALLSLPIPARRLVEHLPDHRLRRLRQAGPDPFVFGPWPRGPRFPLRGRIGQDFFWRAHIGLDGINGSHRGHPFGMEAATAPQPCREGLGPRRRSAWRGFAQILGPHDHTLAI